MREREETRALEEITPHSLRVLVTHALLAAERFPHLHTEVREAAPTAPPVPLHVPAEPLRARIFLKKKNREKTLNLSSAKSKQQPVSNNLSASVRYNYH